MICDFCGRFCKNKNSKVLHEIRCPKNPNKIKSKGGFVEYNKKVKEGLIEKPFSNLYTKAKVLGLPKPELSEESRRRISLRTKGTHLTSEHKRKISTGRKKYLDLHPDMVPFKLNHSSKISYPEQYFIELFKNEQIDLSYHKQVDRYELDFYNEEFNKYVEIDGYQHNIDWMIEHDSIRSKYLYDRGLRGLRIKWANFKGSSDIIKSIVILYIKDFIISDCVISVPAEISDVILLDYDQY